MRKLTRKFMCLLLIIFLLTPVGGAAAADPGQTLDIIDLQLLSGDTALPIVGKQVFIGIGRDNIDFTGTYRFRNPGKDMKITMGVPQSFKSLSGGFAADLKPVHTRLYPGKASAIRKTVEKTVYVGGKAVQGKWQAWDVTAKAGQDLDIRFTYTIESLSFGRSFQVGYLPSYRELANYKMTFSFGPYAPAEVTGLQPEGYKLTNESAVWTVIGGEQGNQKTGSNETGSNETGRYSISIDNAFNTVYPGIFAAVDKAVLNETAKMAGERNYKEALAKVSVLAQKKDLTPQQGEFLTFYKARLDLDAKKYSDVAAGLSKVDPNNLKVTESKEMFTGLYYYLLTEAYKGETKLKELQEAAGKGKEAVLNPVMKEWLDVTSRRMKNVEDILAGKKPDTPVYGKDKSYAWVWPAAIAIAVATLFAEIYLYKQGRKNKK